MSGAQAELGVITAFQGFRRGTSQTPATGMVGKVFLSLLLSFFLPPYFDLRLQLKEAVTVAPGAEIVWQANPLGPGTAQNLRAGQGKFKSIPVLSIGYTT